MYGSVQLTTTDVTYASSGLWYKAPVFIRGFQTSFTFQLSNRGLPDSAHGIVFLIQNDGAGTQASGGVAAGLGYGSPDPTEFTGIKNSFAVEFDCIGNPEMGDPAAIHVSLHTRGKDYNSAHEHFSLRNYTAVADFCGGSSQTTVQITYEPGFLTLSISPIVSPIFDKFPVSVETSLALQAFGTGYIGFTASTGSNSALQELLSWSYQSCESLRCSPYFHHPHQFPRHRCFSGKICGSQLQDFW